MNNAVHASVVNVDVTTHGEFPDVVDYARTKIGSLGRLTSRPILHAHVRLTRRKNPAVEFPVVAQANLDVRGHVVRAQVEAATAHEAVDRLEARLRRRLEHLRELRDAPKGPEAAPPWRHGEVRAHRPQFVPRGAETRRVVRRKSFAMAPCTVDEAAAEMEMLDYDFHLFTEVGSGCAGVVYRRGSEGYRLALVTPTLAGDVAAFGGPVTISPHPVPCLSEDAAMERLALLDLPFLFFIEAAQGRACVLYRRYDGDFGLITPAG
ncbi:ribosome-associated protein [Mycolicibacterium aurum]|uniref:Ribosome-associated protein n=1 Tax=Mycolicibacterium aurum TaxID=1791 RepID=A0A3S4RVX8_MYCAU|nr:HPF/RaiA family ribosome-associated protein [Mycolicibacterium aurum]VEG56574.1 ribosome-associated protein [Mycolicibacterium aurum]